MKNGPYSIVKRVQVTKYLTCRCHNTQKHFTGRVFGCSLVSGSLVCGINSDPHVILSIVVGIHDKFFHQKKR